MDGIMDTEVTTDGGIDQSGMEADYMSEYQLVDDNGSPVSDDDTPSEPEQKQVPKEPEIPAQQENKDPAADYVKGFYKEDGSLDVQKTMELFNRQEAKPQQPIQQTPLEPQIAKPEQIQPVATDPHAQTRENALAAIKLQRYYMQQGFDAETAMAKAEQDIDAHLQQYFMKSEMQKMREEFDKEKAALREEVKSERELAIAEPQAQKNLMNICNQYAKGLAAETLQKAIFDVNIGGQFLLDLFSITNPDKANLTGEQLHKTMNDWFIKNAAKNPKFVESMAINAINQIQKRVMPEMAKMIQQNAVQRTATQQRNNQGPRNGQQPAAHKPSQSQAHNDLDVFFHNVPRDPGNGRPHI
jgi:hypothetical protein